MNFGLSLSNLHDAGDYYERTQENALLNGGSGVIAGSHPHPARNNHPAEAGLEQTPYTGYYKG